MKTSCIQRGQLLYDGGYGTSIESVAPEDTDLAAMRVPDSLSGRIEADVSVPLDSWFLRTGPRSRLDEEVPECF